MHHKCQHIDTVEDLQPSHHVCDECIKTGDTWVHLRICLSCGHIGCCDSSKNRHATKHYRATQHPVVRSIEPEEDWGWCYVDSIMYDLSQGVRKAKVLQ